MPHDTRVLRGGEWAAPLRERLAAPPADMSAWMQTHTRVLKSDAYSCVGMLELGGQVCFAKLYLAKSCWQLLGFSLAYGRGVRSFDAASKLLRSKLPVPAPRACVLVPGGMLLLTEGFAGSADLRALWRAGCPAPQAAKLLLAAGQTLAALHRAGFAHGDCKWSNLLWNDGQLLLVDLEAVRTTPAFDATQPLPHARQLRDLARFLVDARELGASPAQQDQFLACYCDHSACEPGELLAAVAPAAQRILRRHRSRA